jgi:hypothetical protein
VTVKPHLLLTTMSLSCGLRHHKCTINHLENGNHERLHGGKSAKYGTFNVERMQSESLVEELSLAEAGAM